MPKKGSSQGTAAGGAVALDFKLAHLHTCHLQCPQPNAHEQLAMHLNLHVQLSRSLALCDL
jgi:hypothetical protein